VSLGNPEQRTLSQSKAIKHFSPMFATRRIAQTASRRLFSTQLATSTATLTDFNAFNPTEEHKGLSKFVMTGVLPVVVHV
jgi:hypothetical protein